MRQHINNNWIAYILLAGLLVCGVVFVATPVMAQDITNAELKASIDNLKGGIETNRWIIIIVMGLISLGFAGFMFMGNFVFQIWGKLKSVITDTEWIKKRIDSVLLNNPQEIGRDRISDSNSPRVLNRNGEFLLRYTKADDYIKNNFKELYQQMCRENGVENLENIEPYKIEIWALKIMRDKRYDTQDINFQGIQELVYKEPIQYDALALAMGLKLRDMVCEKNKIPIEKQKQQM